MQALTSRALLLALLIGCGDAAERSSDAAEDDRADTGGQTARGDGGTEASSDRDASESMRDAGPREGGSSLMDGGGMRDARGDEGGSTNADASMHDWTATGDAQSGNGATDRRRQICGETTSWPRPFDGASMAAQPVGTSTFGFLEGPVWLAEEGVLVFTDMDMSNVGAQGPAARIRRLRPPSTFDVFVQSSNSNGLALWGSEAVIGATHDTQALSLFDLGSGARTQLAVLADGKHFNSPNDLTVRSDGTIYFTDPDWQKTDSRPSETMKMGVYRLPPPLNVGGPNNALLIEGGLDKPNGVALSPDERTLYVGSVGSEIWKYTVASDGTVSNRTVFANTGSSDGMTIDCAGNLYVSSGTVEVFAPDGSRVGDITLGADPTNVAFGGSDRKTLYITAGSRLYSLALNVPGFPY